MKAASEDQVVESSKATEVSEKEVDEMDLSLDERANYSAHEAFTVDTSDHEDHT